MLKWADLVEKLSWATTLEGRAWPVEIEVLSGADVESHGQVVNISRGRIHILVPAHITAGRLLVLRSRSRTAKAKALYSRPLSGQYLVALAVPPHRYQAAEARPDERRQEPRFKAHEAITLTAISVQSANSIRGWLVDVSQSGLGLVLEAFAPPGQLVEIRAGSMVAFGEVLYCRQEPTKQFRVGVIADQTLLVDLRELHSSFATKFLARLRSNLTHALHSLGFRLKPKRR